MCLLPLLERFPFLIFNDSPDQRYRSRLHNSEETEVNGSLVVQLWSNQTGILDTGRLKEFVNSRTTGQAEYELASDLSDFIVAIRAANQNLIRLGLISTRLRPAPVQDVSHQEDETNSEDHDRNFCLTSLGLAFVAACQQPTRQADRTLPFY
jgi:hypothetical protein